MDDFIPNSNRFKNEQKEKEALSKTDDKKITPVVKGKVVAKKRSGLSKVKDVFVSDDVHNIKSYVFDDVLIPATKKAIADIVKNGIEMILYGGSGRSGSSFNSSHVSYDRFSDKNNRPPATRTSIGYNFDDIILEDRGEAEMVLTRMDEILETYQMVTVADLYDLIGVTCNYTDNNYGWTSLRNADVVRVYNGWKLRLPKALPIKSIR